MKLILKNPLEIRLLVDTIFINPTNIFISPEGVPMQNITITIKSTKRIVVESDEETGEQTLTEVTMNSPYNLENPTSVQFVPKEMIDALVFAAVSDPETKEQVLTQLSQNIDDLGYNQMFIGSLEGLKLNILDVII